MAIKNSTSSLVIKLSLLAVVMLGFTYAMVPIYKSACDAGWLDATRDNSANPYANVNANVDTSNTQVDKSRWITVEFVANMNEKMPWNFEAQQKSIRIHPGEMTNVVYEVVNTTDRETVGVAVPSYGPALAVEYFKKVECFCFTKQTMAPHERRGMPVVFVVTPDLPKDVNTITLSYTFFEVKS
jgi:cytochrome c oxidase assembly protein subunit 11